MTPKTAVILMVVLGIARGVSAYTSASKFLDKEDAWYKSDDAKHMADFTPQFARYLERLSHHRARTIEDPELVTFRWMLEELRVSYYAQELGTVVPVSAKKMDQQWERVRM